MQNMGYCDLPTKYDPLGSYRIYHDFLQEAENHFILSSSIDLDVPLRLIHGKKDEDICYNTSYALFRQFTGEDKSITIIEEGDHRLSKPNEIMVTLEALQDLV